MLDLPTGNDPRGIVVRDLDGDGLPDIAVANWADGTVWVYRNLGTIGGVTSNSFAAPLVFAVGPNPQDLKAADLDGDGKPDLVTANNNYGTTNSLSLLRNTSTPGAISFAPAIALAGLPTAYCLAIGDMDGDGQLDLVVSSFDQGQSVSVYRNLSSPGNLSFAPSVDFPAGGWGNGVAIGDLDGDGKPDLAVVTQLPDHLSIFKNLSTPGSFTTNSLAPRLDFPTGWNPNGVAIGDLNGDGQPDIAFAICYGATLSVYQNVTQSGLPPVAPAITLQPTNLTLAVNSAALFSVAATGTQPLIYQWYFNGTNIPWAIYPTLVLSNVQPWQAGNYFVTVSNLAGGVISSNAALTVFIPQIPPAIVSQTPNQIVLVGGTAIFGVNASGTAPLNFQWNRNGAPIPNATNSTYLLPNAQLTDSGSKFNCLVTNLYGLASSTNVSLKVLDTEANDLCSGAIVITNASYTNAQSTLKATSFGDPTPDCVDGFGHGVWYEFTAPVAGLLDVDTFGSDFDTGLAIYTGTCDALTEVACDDDTPGVGVVSQIFLPTTAGTTYYILAGGYQSDAGDLMLHLNHLTPPSFAVWPTNLSVVVSSNAIFNPTISGTQPMSFQWFFNNTPLTDGGRISGSTNSTLTIANVQTNDGGNDVLVASNIVGVTTSSVAVLTPVILPPSFITPPVTQAVPQGSNVNFFAVVAGTPPYSYQWLFNGTPLTDDGWHIVGALTSSLTISNLTTADAGDYTLTVSNLSGAISATASLIVMTPPVFTSPPVGRSVPPGLPTTFTASASGIPAPYYQWLLNGTNLTGWSFSNSLPVTAVGANNLGAYQVVAQNSVGSVTSVVAQLTFGPVAAWGRNLNNEVPATARFEQCHRGGRNVSRQFRCTGRRCRCRVGQHLQD